MCAGNGHCCRSTCGRHPEAGTIAFTGFQQEQDAYVRIDWYGNVLFPHGILQDRLQLLEGAVRNLKEGRLSAALRKLYEIDSNRYAFLFEEEVYRHFTSYALDQSADRLKWGTGRIIGFENFSRL